MGFCSTLCVVFAIVCVIQREFKGIFMWTLFSIILLVSILVEKFMKTMEGQLTWAMYLVLVMM